MSDELREKIQEIVCPKEGNLGLDCNSCDYFNSVAQFACNNPKIGQILSLLEEDLPTDEEIHIRIVNCMWGYMTVPELREWLKEGFRIGG